MELVGFIFLFVAAVCSVIVFYGFMDEKQYWNKVPYRAAVFVCVSLYLFAVLLSIQFYITNNSIMFKLPAVIFAFATMLLIAIAKGKFSKE